MLVRFGVEITVSFIAFASRMDIAKRLFIGSIALSRTVDAGSISFGRRFPPIR